MLGEWVFDIFLSLPDTGDNDNYERAVEALNHYFIPKRNVNYEIFKFRETVQQSDESLNQFYSKLRQLAQACNFHSIDDEIKSQIISKCHSRKLRSACSRNA